MQKVFIVVFVGVLISSCSLSIPAAKTDQKPELPKVYPTPNAEGKLALSEAEWKARLTDQEFNILWQHGTEAAWSGDLLHNEKKGTYVTAGCGQAVFRSEDKYDSGTGWPSFTKPIEGSVVLKTDSTFGLQRTEVLSNCGEHLGHVFDDGPPPTGKRYCMNAVALDFVEDK